jgi:di/tricarboxylate transporter
MMPGVAGFSAFVNNTPIVAMMIPYVQDLGKRKGIAPSKLLIPLSYATILGGMITVVGTSTNLVMNGFLEQSNEPVLIWSDFLYLGLMVTVGGILFILFVGHKLLPERKDSIEAFKEQSREYIVETVLGVSSELNGKTVAEAHLRNLKGVYLVDIIRNDRVISPVSPQECLTVGDKLVFAGDTNRIVELVNENNGLSLPHPNGTADKIQMTEVVIPANSSLDGQLVKESDFRNRFDAAIIAIHRNGERIRGKIGDVELRAGDLLLLSTGKNFFKQEDMQRDLYVISTKKEIAPKKPMVVWALRILLIGTVGLIIAGVLELFVGSLLILSGMVAAGALQIKDIKRELDLDLIAVLVCALALGDALITSGAAEVITHGVIQVFKPFGTIGMLTGIFLFTVILTSFITNPAAVALMFPIAYTLAHDLGISGTPFYVAVTFAASAAFMTPFGYQTNLMVYGPGGYSFADYLRIGTPLTLIYSFICIFFIVFRYNLI